MHDAPRILIVDDSEEDVLLAAAQIRRWARDAVIRRVDNAADFNAAIQSGPWDLVLCDHNMPCFDSGTALELLGGAARTVPFFVYSGYFSPRQRENAVREGASGYVDKRDIAGLMRAVDCTLNAAPIEAKPDVNAEVRTPATV
jgi:CheY-like chemotaxis protein